jgi:hypothetical protein
MRELLGWRSLALLGLVSAIGCQGSIESAAAPASSFPDGITGGDGPDGDRPPAEAADEAVAVPMRRLTRAQYNQTVTDLLGIEGDHAADFGLDEPGGGFAANGTAPVASLQVENYERVAEALADRAVQNPEQLARCAAAPADEGACLTEFLRDFGTRAYRRPLSAEETTRYERLFAAGKSDDGTFADGLRLVLATMLQSPHFLYRVEVGTEGERAGERALTDHEIAARLSYFLTGSMPDDALLAAAAAGELQTPAGRRTHAERLLAAAAARRSFRSFHTQWMEMEDLGALEKNDIAYPEFTPALRAAMQDELTGFLDYVMDDGEGGLETLLSANVAFVGGPLFEVYGMETPDDDAPRIVTLPAGQRAGLFTLASVMARHSHPDQSSPVKRGYMVLDKLLCTTPPPPPAGVDITTPQVDPDSTTRERFEEHRKNPSCASCHQLMDPLGFPFEIYDGMGRHRDSEGGEPVDATSVLAGTDNDGPVRDAVALMQRLAASETVRRCMTRQWFRYAYGRLEDNSSPGDQWTLERGYEAFEQGRFRVPALLVALTTTRAFSHLSRGE